MIGVSISDVLMGDAALVVGLDEQPDGYLRVFLGARYMGLFVLLGPNDEDEAKIARAVREGWKCRGHVLAPLWFAEALLCERGFMFPPHST